MRGIFHSVPGFFLGGVLSEVASPPPREHSCLPFWSPRSADRISSRASMTNIQ